MKVEKGELEKLSGMRGKLIDELQGILCGKSSTLDQLAALRAAAVGLDCFKTLLMVCKSSYELEETQASKGILRVEFGEGFCDFLY